MAFWRDFFSTGDSNAAPEWMSQNVGTAAAQVIWYPAQERDQRPAYPACLAYPAPGPQSNYRLYRDVSGSYYATRDYTVELLRVPICCEGCVEKIKSRMIDIDGVRAVSVDQAQQMVTVSGTADLAEILNACKKIFKRSKWRP